MRTQLVLHMTNLLNVLVKVIPLNSKVVVVIPFVVLPMSNCIIFYPFLPEIRTKISFFITKNLIESSPFSMVSWIINFSFSSPSEQHCVGFYCPWHLKCQHVSSFTANLSVNSFLIPDSGITNLWYQKKVCRLFTLFPSQTMLGEQSKPIFF